MAVICAAGELLTKEVSAVANNLQQLMVMLPNRLHHYILQQCSIKLQGFPFTSSHGCRHHMKDILRAYIARRLLYPRPLVAKAIAILSVLLVILDPLHMRLSAPFLAVFETENLCTCGAQGKARC